MLYLEAGRGDWIDELECSPILVGYDPVTGWPVYEGDTCEVYYDSASCPWYPPLEDVPF